ncbi:hypothetical protein QQ045_000347 [Rhodiola kirilowii]
MDKPSAKEIKSTTTDRTNDQATPPPKKSNLVYGSIPPTSIVGGRKKTAEVHC